MVQTGKLTTPNSMPKIRYFESVLLQAEGIKRLAYSRIVA
jgi:hypothetical protein